MKVEPFRKKSLRPGTFLSLSGETLAKPMVHCANDRLGIGSRIIKVRCEWRLSKSSFCKS